jgi:hypothetical protein
MKVYSEPLRPNLNNFIDSIREVGYSTEEAISDIIDNSISSLATSIQISALENPTLRISILDNGNGMNENELIEAMRLSSKGPNDERTKNDLGRFGLGLKMASFSQCKKLTVFSKKDLNIKGFQWDLDFIAEKGDWYIKVIDSQDEIYINEIDELNKFENGTIVIWENIDKIDNLNFNDELVKIKYHIGLIFHKFIEGKNTKKIEFSLNNQKIEFLNPFYESHPASQKLQVFPFKYKNGEINITPHLLPHHSKINNENEYNKYGLKDGYFKSQGFYVYREHRLITFGTWWSLLTASEAYKLIRIEIDIPNTMDKEWSIDISKSKAKPNSIIRKDLKSTLDFIKPKGTRIYTGRTTRTNFDNVIHLWDYKPRRDNNKFALSINRNHPLIDFIQDEVSEEVFEVINTVFDGIEKFLPIETILAQLVSDPKVIDQDVKFERQELLNNILENSSLSREQKELLLNTEYFK